MDSGLRPYTWTTDTAPVPRLLNARTEQTPFGVDLMTHLVDPYGPDAIAVNGGVGCGKSVSIAQVAKVVALTRPGAEILISASSLPLLTSVMKKRCEEAFGGSASWRGGMIFPHFCFHNGSKVIFRAYQCHVTKDESSNSLEGNDYHLAFFDEVEQLPETVITHALQRTRKYAVDVSGQVHTPKVVFIGRPGIVDFWVREVRRLGDQGRTVQILTPRTWDNPVLWTQGEDGVPKSAYIENLRARLCEEEFHCVTAHIPGSEMPTKGSVYGEFSSAMYPAGNVIEFEYTGQDVYVSVDFGRAFPAVAFFVREVVDGTSVDILFDELQPDECLTPTLARLIAEKGYNLVEVVCDPAGGAANAQTGISDIKVLRDTLGVPVVSTTSRERTRILAGISKVRARLRSAEGVRSLLVSKSVWDRAKRQEIGKRSIRSLLLYTWKHTERATAPTKGGPGQPDHIADVIRYYVIRYRWGDGPTGGAPVASDIYAPPTPPRRFYGG